MSYLTTIALFVFGFLLIFGVGILIGKWLTDRYL